MPYRKLLKLQAGWEPYALAVAGTGIVLAIRLLLDTKGVRGSGPFELFALPVVIAAWIGGWGPGLLATGLSTLVIDFFFLEPRYSLTINRAGDVYPLVLYMLEGAVISWFG